MRYRWRDIPWLFRTPLGRNALRSHLYFRAWPLYRRAAGFYRASVGRGLRVVTVVGSFGKTTTAKAIRRSLGIPTPRRAEANGWTAVAQALMGTPAGQRHTVVEVGIDGVGQMAQHARMLRPDVVVVTAIGTEHHRSLGSLESTRNEKAHMVRSLPPDGVAVLNGDDPRVRSMAEETRARVITCGFSERNEIRASDPELDWPRGTRFTLHVGDVTRSLRVRLLGRKTLFSILAAVAVASAEGRSLDQAIADLERMAPVPRRLQPAPLPNGALLLRDEYKSSLETVHVALDLLSEIPAKRRIVVLGEVSEPPGSQGPIYREIGARIAKIADRAIFVGANFQRYATGARRAGLSGDALVDAGRDALRAAEVVKDDLRPGDVVLLKGRDTQRLERVALSLAGRHVRCVITRCDSSPRCDTCPMLERGWNGLRVVV